MIETTKEKVRDYIIAIILTAIAVLIGTLYAKELIDKNMNDRSVTLTTTRKTFTNFFKNLDSQGYILYDFSTYANFDYTLGTVNLFNKDYKIDIKNTHYECTPDCKYMYKVFVDEKEIYSSNFLVGIKTGVIGQYVAIQEIYQTGLMKLILIRANDSYIAQEYTFVGGLNISYNEGIYTFTFREENCSSGKYDNVTIKYNKTEDTFKKTSNEAEAIGNKLTC